MTIREVTTEEHSDYNSVVDHPVQTWEWGEFREKTGNKILRLGLYDKNKLVEGYLLTLHRLPYTNRYVAMLAKIPAPTRQMLMNLRNWAKQENIIFIRLEPNISIASKSSRRIFELFKTFKMFQGRPFFNKKTPEIDLTQSEEELLKKMHPKTRYNIRLAQKYGVEVAEDNSEESFARYLDLMDETTKRQNYFAHSEHYHKLMWKTLRTGGIAHLLKAVYPPSRTESVSSQVRAKSYSLRRDSAPYEVWGEDTPTARSRELHQGTTLASWILFVWKDKLYYPYGASSSEHRNVMAPYAIMWQAIKFGKRLNLKTFDLWGSDEAKGYTRFKEGFGPENIEYLGTWDLPINNKLYYLYRLAEEIRWRFLKLRARLIPLSSFR
ncbi:MAG: femAB [Microgenomates group bacterium Gr01-1014_5]|nr:MAG: femAB [Microgenomates group bacterium Gr01-1014_5]